MQIPWRNTKKRCTLNFNFARDKISILMRQLKSVPLFIAEYLFFCESWSLFQWILPNFRRIRGVFFYKLILWMYRILLLPYQRIGRLLSYSWAGELQNTELLIYLNSLQPPRVSALKFPINHFLTLIHLIN